MEKVIKDTESLFKTREKEYQETIDQIEVSRGGGGGMLPGPSRTPMGLTSAWVPREDPQDPWCGLQSVLLQLCSSSSSSLSLL